MHFANRLQVIRNPDKLHNILITQKGVPSGIVDRYLTVHRGDVKDPTAVAQALVSPTNAKCVYTQRRRLTP